MIKPCRYAIILCALTLSGKSLAHDPVILIPGLTAQPSAMDTMRSNFVSAGWDSDRVYTWTDSTNMTGDLGQAAEELGQKVDQVLNETNASKVVLVTWSPSTLAGHYYLKNIDSSKTSVYISMAGPHHGTSSVDACTYYTACVQMQYDSDFLTALNSGTETPGAPAVAYQTQRSDCDTNVTPTDTAMLEGAINVKTTDCITHFDFSNNAGVFNSVKDFIKVNESSGGDGGLDTTPPTVNVTAPSDGASVSGNVMIKADANDNVAVAYVEFYVNGSLLGSDSSSPYTIDWNTTNTANGGATIKAKAHDDAGNIGTDNDTTVTVANGGDGNNGDDGLFCGSATNSAHEDAGRAVSYGTAPYNSYFAKGPWDYLGLGDSAVTALKEIKPDYFKKVTGCN